MKVAFLAYELGRDHGWGRYLNELLERLPQEGIEPVVLASRHSQPGSFPYQPTLMRPGPPYTTPLWISWSYFKSRPHIQECDIVHSLIEYFAPVGALLAGQRPFLFNIYGTYAISILKTAWLGPIMRWTINQANGIIPISHYTEKRLKAVAPQALTRVIRSGVDLDEFRPIPAPRAKQERYILSVGAMKPRKGHHIVLKAFARVADEFADVNWVIVGSQGYGDFAQQLKAEIKELGLDKRVRFVEGASPAELVQLYQHCYLFVLAPQNVGDAFEGYPLVYGEANACGKPIIATRDNGAEETVQDGYNGLLVNQDSVEDVERALRYYLQNPHKTAEMGRNGRAFVEELTWAHTASRYAQYYRQLLDRKK